MARKTPRPTAAALRLADTILRTYARHTAVARTHELAHRDDAAAYHRGYADGALTINGAVTANGIIPANAIAGLTTRSRRFEATRPFYAAGLLAAAQNDWNATETFTAA